MPRLIEQSPGDATPGAPSPSINGTPRKKLDLGVTRAELPNDHVGVPVTPPTQLYDHETQTHAVWSERPTHAYMEAVRNKVAEEAEQKAHDKVKVTVGPYAETVPDNHQLFPFQYGELRFEENGRIVPYLIVPETRRNPDELLDALRKMKAGPSSEAGGRTLAKPSILFDVGSSGYNESEKVAADVGDKDGCESYLSWVHEVYDNEKLSAAWGWTQWECKHCKGKVRDWPDPREEEQERKQNGICEQCERRKRSGQEHAQLPVPKHGATRAGCIPRFRRGTDRTYQCLPDGPAEQQPEPEPEPEPESQVVPVPVHLIDKRDAAREFVDRLMSVANMALTSVQEGGSWLFTAAGRGAAAQLFGDTIERFRGPLANLNWVQYASLQDPHLFGLNNHADFVKQLKDSATEDPEFNGDRARVYYHSNRDHYPSFSSLYSHGIDFDKHMSNLKDKLRDFESEFNGIDLHPCATHLIFFDAALSRGKHTLGLSQHGDANTPLPHDHVHAIKKALIDRGAAEGMILMNGGLREVNCAMSHVSQLNPVVSFKSIGGASELVSRIFQQEQQDREEEQWEAFRHEECVDVEGLERQVEQVERKRWVLTSQRASSSDLRALDLELKNLNARIKREKKEVEDTKKRVDNLRKTKEENKQRKARRLGYAPDRLCDVEALRDDMREQTYSLVRKQADLDEMLVLDIVPRNRRVEDLVHMEMSAMRSKQGENIERTILDFAATEAELIDAAWDHAALYRLNTEEHETRSVWLDLLTNLSNMVIVSVVVAKQWWFPNLDAVVDECERISVQSTAGLEDSTNYDDEPGYSLMSDFLIVMPIINTLFLTLSSQLDPHTKCNALSWADRALESETYMYRTRALHYSRLASAGWQAIADGPEQNANKDSSSIRQLATTTLQKRCECINQALYSDSTFAQSSLDYHKLSHSDYWCEGLRSCVGEVAIAFTTFMLLVGTCVFTLGSYAKGWALDLAPEPEAMSLGRKGQLIGLTLVLFSSALLTFFSIATRKVLWQLWFILGLSSGIFSFCRSAGNSTENLQRIAALVMAVVLVVIVYIFVVEHLLVFCTMMMNKLCSRREGHTKHTREYYTKRTRNDRLAKTLASKLEVVDRDTDTRNGRLRRRLFDDDGYARLSGDEYLACRTRVQLQRFRRDVQPAGYKFAFFRLCALLASTVSVGLGSFDKDIFIAASTALVCFFTTANENGGYKQEMQYKNVAIKRLQTAVHQWTRLSFAEKRDLRNLDKLVQQTEEAAMSYFEAQYPNGGTAFNKEAKSEDGDGGTKDEDQSD